MLHQARRKHFLSGTATGEGSVGSGDRPREARKNFFTFIFQLSALALVHLCALHCTAKAVPSGGRGATGHPEKLASEYNKIFVHSS